MEHIRLILESLKLLAAKHSQEVPPEGLISIVTKINEVLRVLSTDGMKYTSEDRLEASRYNQYEVSIQQISSTVYKWDIFDRCENILVASGKTKSPLESKAIIASILGILSDTTRPR